MMPKTTAVPAKEKATGYPVIKIRKKPRNIKIDNHSKPINHLINY
jgi:hypothetical protein